MIFIPSGYIIACQIVSNFRFQQNNTYKIKTKLYRITGNKKIVLKVFQMSNVMWLVSANRCLQPKTNDRFPTRRRNSVSDLWFHQPFMNQEKKI